jgi:AcrR family transcriptional regulator
LLRFAGRAVLTGENLSQYHDLGAVKTASQAASRLGRGERRQQAHEETRRAILDAALELFVADGYGQVSIRNVAARVEFSPGSIYSYFPSKDDIFFALAEEGFRLLEAVEPAGASNGGTLDELRDTIWRFYEFSKKQPQYFALVFLDRHVPRIGREYEQFAFMADLKKRILARVQLCIDEGVLPSTVRADVALRLLWAPVIGITSFQLSQRMPPEVDTDALVRDAIDTTIAGLRAGAPVHSLNAPSAAGGSPRDDAARNHETDHS